MAVFVSRVLPHLAICPARVAWSLGAARAGEHGAAGACFRSLQPAGIGWRCVLLEGPGNRIRSYSFWWFSGQICAVKPSDKFWCCSHPQPCAEPGAVKGSDLAAHATIQTWLHTEDRGDRTESSGRVQEGAHPFSSAQPMPWVVSMLTRGRKSTESCLRYPLGSDFRGLQTRGDPAQTGHVFAWLRIRLGVPGVGYLMGVRKLLPSIPERQRAPASAAASWRGAEKDPNLPCREGGECQPCRGGSTHRWAVGRVTVTFCHPFCFLHPAGCSSAPVPGTR